MRTTLNIFRRDDWNIGIIYEPIVAFLRPNHQHIVTWLHSAGKTKYFADPFGVIVGGKLYVFCEEYDYRSRKGRIVVIEVADGVASNPVVALESSHHMSYPYLLEHEGAIYCIPETEKANEISLYRSMQFPRDWRKVGTLVKNFAGIDPTVFCYEGSWWLACIKGPEKRESHQLFLWHSSSLLGPWLAHRANPVKVGLTSSRCAGTPFVDEGHLYRPAQDCSKTYGGRIVLNHITKLTPSEFEEEVAMIIEPSWDGPYREGTHTISSVDGITLVDGKRRIFRRAVFTSALMARLTSTLR